MIKCRIHRSVRNEIKSISKLKNISIMIDWAMHLQKHISGWIKLSLGGLAALTALTFSSVAHSQNIPDIELPAEATTPAAAVKKDKSSSVGSALLELQDRFVRLPVSDQNDSDGQLIAGMVTIEAIATGSADALLTELQDLGLEDGTAFGKLVSGKIPLSAVASASALSTLKHVRLATAFVRSGIADNQADIAMETFNARSTFGVDGTGVTIGILSDSYDQLGGEVTDIASGDLPSGGVTVLDDTAFGPNSDEGRAMAQLIHDIAPGADLLFHTAFNGRPDFAQGILDLANAGADIIVDDIGYFAAPFFQDGPVAQAVDQVTADGVVYFSAAGNSSDNSYEAPYVDSGDSFEGGTFPVSNLHEFVPGDNVQEFQLNPGQSLLLSIQWDQPFASSGGTGSASDVDAILINSSSTVIAEATDGNIDGDAVEILFYINESSGPETVGLIIGVFDGPVPGVLKWINFDGDIPHNYSTNSSTVFAHPNAAGTVSVGAAAYIQTPPFGITPPLIEPFSSLGGLDILFDTAGNLLPAPDDRNKPDVTAPDGVDTTFFGGGDFDGTGFPNFFGTSAAAPNAAALAALQLECNSLLSPADIRTQQIGTATDMETAGFDNISGAGLVNGVGALGQACMPAEFVCNGKPVDVFIGNGDVPTSQADVILGTSGPDTIFAMGGDDTICGLGGNDSINGGGGNDWIDAGPGDDQVRGANDDDVIFGDEGDDALSGGLGDDTVAGEQGDDNLNGNSGNDNLDGGDGIDNISGGPGNDTIETGPGGNVGTVQAVRGGNGDDTIAGGPDADIIYGEAGADTITGGDGNDRLFGGGGEDNVDGQAGDDLVRGDASADVLKGGPGNDVVTGSGGDDLMYGGDGADTMWGSQGDDSIFGQSGNDTLNGGDGNDDLDGGSATDVCNGNRGTGDTASFCETQTNIP